MKVLVIDNYDSFVYNLVQYIGELGAEPIGLPKRQVSPWNSWRRLNPTES